MTDAELDQCRHDGALLRSIVADQVKLKREGREWKGLCPFHNEITPSFIVYEDGHFHCFGCGAHGTSFDYVMKRDGVGFSEAAKRVAAEIGAAPSRAKPEQPANCNGTHTGAIWQPIVPPPADASPPTADQLRCDRLHEYRDANDRVLCYVRRVEAKSDKAKQFYPLTFGVLDGKTGWHTKAPNKPKPLYGLNRLHAAPDAVILLCEGEKSADAAQRLFPDMVGMAWMGGVNGDGSADLAPIADRDVIIWGDADEVGGKAVERLTKRLPEAHWVETADLPDGFDAADLERDGCTDPEAWLIARERAPVRETKPEPKGGEDDLSNPEQAGPEPEVKLGELFGPPTEADYITALTIADLAALDEIAFGRIVKPKAALLGVTPTALTKARSAAKAAAAKAARDGEKAAKAKAVAEAKAAKAEAKAREKEAREKEREARAREARARLNAQKTPQPLTDDDDDPLREWIPPDPATLPEIIVAGGERPANADAGLAVMKAAGVPFYQRGKDLVRVCRIRLKQSNGKMVRVPAISTVTKPMMLRALGLCAKWLVFNKDLDLVQIDPPADLGDHILSMIGEWPFPPLRGVIATQTMRYDGSLLTEPGYDRATGLVLFNPPEMPVIPRQPTKADALESLALLRDLLIEVDFAEDGGVSLSGATSMIMTPVLRGMMPVAPLHVVTKPAAGTGGSYMGDIAAAIAIGEPCPVFSLTLKNDEENEKRLSSAAESGQPIIAIDNFTGTLIGDFLCQLVERPMPQIRILGRTEMVRIPNNHCTFANGNNIAIAVDMVRRTVQISLDADVENPESRTFTRNPVAEIMADRGKYIAAILTIARAYRVAGSPGKLKPRLSFEDWSDNIRSALVWLGWPDCDESIKAVRAADPISAKLHAVIAAWAAELMVSVGYYTSELVERASQFVGDGSNDRAHPALWEALFAVAGNNTGQLDSARLGLWLQAHLNRVSAGHKLLVDRSNKARPRWSVEPR